MMIAWPVLLLVAAVDTPSSSSALVEDVETCRSISDNVERLACFDRATAKLAEARARRDILVMDRTQVRKTRRSLFGFVMPSFKLFGGNAADDAAEEEITQIDSKVVAVSSSGYNRQTLTLEDGTVWQTLESSSSFEPRSGDRITIKKTAFGYSAKSGWGQTPVRRVR